MTDKKLRKFKLVDKEGYFSSNELNQSIFIDELKGGLFEGYIDDFGCLTTEYAGDLITPEEFKFFEEVVDDTKDEVSSEWDAYPPVGTLCEYSAMDSNVWWKCIFVGKVGDFVYVDAPHLDDVQKFQPKHVHLRPIQPKSWQEVLCEEFDIEYDSDNDVLNFLRGYSESGAIKLAKRIIELSEGN